MSMLQQLKTCDVAGSVTLCMAGQKAHSVVDLPMYTGTKAHCAKALGKVKRTDLRYSVCDLGNRSGGIGAWWEGPVALPHRVPSPS